MSTISEDFSSANGSGVGQNRPSLAESKLDSTRDELRRLFVHEEEFEDPDASRFPRSKIVRMLTKGNALTYLAIGAGGFLLMKPKLLRSVIRVVPVGALVRLAIVRFMTRRR